MTTETDMTHAFHKRLWTIEFLEGKEELWDEIGEVVDRLRALVVDKINQVADAEIQRHMEFVFHLKSKKESDSFWKLGEANNHVVIDEKSYKLLVEYHTLIYNIIYMNEQLIKEVEVEVDKVQKTINLTMMIGYEDSEEEDEDDSEEDDSDEEYDEEEEEEEESS